MKRQEIVFDDVVRADTTMPQDTVVSRPLKYGVWEKLPAIASIFLPNQLPDGYAFMGWTTVLSGSTDYIDGEYVKNLTQPDLVQSLYGTWIHRYYYINYNANGGVIEPPSGETDPDYTKTQLVYSVDGVELPPSGGAVKRDGGWQLDGWSKVPYGLAGYPPGSTQTGIFSDFNTGTLYAIWKPAEYTVIFHSNWPKGNDEEQTADQILKRSIITKLRKNTFNFTHWEFAGWATSPTGPVAYIDEQRVVNLSEGEEVNLYARWKQIEFVMTFHKNAPNIEEDDYPVVTDNDITGEMPEEVFELDKPKTIDLNQFVYPKTIGDVETRDRAFNGWLDASGGYTEEDDGHNRIKWVDGQEIILDRDVDVYAYWDDCIYIEYDATNFKRLKSDFERDYPLLAQAGIYQLVDRVHPGTMYKVRNDFLKTLYGCNLVAWGSKEAVNFQPGDEIHADLFNAGEHFELVPLYEPRYEIYNGADKSVGFVWGIDSSKTNDKTYINSEQRVKCFEILPRVDYIEEYLDVNLTITTKYKNNGGAMTLYWKPESDKDCKWEKLYDLRSGSAGKKNEKSITVSVPGWKDSKRNRYVYYLVIAWCPYDGVPIEIKWGDPDAKSVRGWKRKLKRKWKKWKNKITNVASAFLVANPQTALMAIALKPTRDRIKSATEKTAKEVARVKIAGHQTGKAVIKAVASKEFKIATGAASVIAGILTLGAGSSVVAGVSSILSGACSIVSATTNDDVAKKYLDAAAIGFSIVSVGTSLGAANATSSARAALPQAEDTTAMLWDAGVEAGMRVNQSLSDSVGAALQYQGWVQKFNRLSVDYVDSVFKLAELRELAQFSNAVQISTAITNALNVAATVGELTGAYDFLNRSGNGLPASMKEYIDKIYVRESDNAIFVKLKDGSIIQTKLPGIDWKPICIMSALTIDSIIYPAEDQGIVEINC